MKLFFKILKIITVLIIAVTTALFTVSFLMQDKIAGIFLKSLNKNISTKYDFRSVRLSFLKKFPKASLDLKDVVVHSSPGFDVSCFAGINTDTLLSAKSVSMEFSITDIIKGIYNIERIGITEGRLNLFTDTYGLVNYEITAEEEESSGDEFTINLERINLTDMKAVYDNRATKLIIKGFAESGRLKSRIAGDDIYFTATGALQIDQFQLYNFKTKQTFVTDLDINLYSSAKGILFNKSIINIDGYNFELSGFVSSDDVLDLSLTGKRIDISGIKKYIPDKYADKFSAYNPAGLLNIESKIKGLLSRTSNPQVEINFILDKGRVTYGNSALSINNFSLKGFFTNGSSKIPETSSLSITDFSGSLGSAWCTGSFNLSDFKTLNGNLNLKGTLIPSELKEFFNIKEVSSAAGTIGFDLKIAGKIPKKDKYALSDFVSLNPVCDLNFNAFEMGLKNDNILVTSVNGNLFVSDTSVAKNLRFTFKDQDFRLDGEFIKLLQWISGKPVIMKVIADVSCNRLKPELFSAAIFSSDTTSVRKKAFSLPGDLILDLKFNIDALTYKTFSAEKIFGVVSYKPRILDFKTLKLSSLDGIISGNGFVAQNTDKSFIGKGNFNFEKLDINKAFISFRNFGQDFVKAENLAGTLSGSLSLLIPMDSVFHPLIKSVVAEGKYLLINGALIDFEPIKELSSFIALSELENIHFEQLENDFFIRNNFLYMPMMEVKSSAADLSVSGKHDFENNYEYHVKILLSEMLSKKIRKPKPNTTEFGAVKEDGLGRTSFLLKIQNKGEEIDVDYDVKAVAGQIRNEIKTERQTLKTIINEEYGGFKTDSAARKKPVDGSPRFKIIWEDNDTSEVKKEPPSEQKEITFRNLLKKK